MTGLFLLFMLLAGAVLQGLLPAPAWMGQPRVPILLSVALFYVSARDEQLALTAALLAGLLQDALSLMPLGYSSLAFCAVLLAGRYFSVWMVRSTLTTAVVLGGLGSMAATLLSLVMLILGVGYVPPPLHNVILKVLGTGVFGAVCTPLVILLADRLHRMVGLEDMHNDYGTEPAHRH